MQIGDRVIRIEEREEVLSTILEIDGDNIFISYDEGGEGWWPTDCLRPIDE